MKVICNDVARSATVPILSRMRNVLPSCKQASMLQYILTHAHCESTLSNDSNDSASDYLCSFYSTLLSTEKLQLRWVLYEQALRDAEQLRKSIRGSLQTHVRSLVFTALPVASDILERPTMTHTIARARLVLPSMLGRTGEEKTEHAQLLGRSFFAHLLRRSAMQLSAQVP